MIQDYELFVYESSYGITLEFYNIQRGKCPQCIHKVSISWN